MGHTYPYFGGDRLIGTLLNHDLELSAAPTPPTGVLGGAGQFKQWMDTSTSPPTLRMATVARATAGAYVASEWATLGTLDLANRVFNQTPGSIHIGGTPAAGGLSVYVPGSAPPNNSGTTQSAGHIARFGGNSGYVIDFGDDSFTGMWLDVTNAGNLSLHAPLILNPVGGGVTIGMGMASPRSTLEAGGAVTSVSGFYGQNIGSSAACGLVSGDATHTGFIAWTTPSSSLLGGTRTAFMGFDNLTDRVTLNLNTGVSFAVTGSMNVAGAGNFGGALSAQVANGVTGFELFGSAGTSFIAMTPESAASTAQFGYYLGSGNWGTVINPGAGVVNGTFFVGGPLTAGGVFNATGGINTGGLNVSSASAVVANGLTVNGGGTAISAPNGNLVVAGTITGGNISGAGLTLGGGIVANGGGTTINAPNGDISAGGTLHGQVLFGGTDGNAGTLQTLNASNRLTFRWDGTSVFSRVDGGNEQRIPRGGAVTGFDIVANVGAPAGQDLVVNVGGTSYRVHCDAVG